MKTLFDDLNKLYELRSTRDEIHRSYDAIRDQAIPDEIKTLLADIEAEATAELEPIRLAIAELEAFILDKTKELEESQQGTHLICIYNPGGETVTLKDFREFILRWQNLYPKVAEDALSIIKKRKASASIQTPRR